jgi:hypothetical protein
MPRYYTTRAINTSSRNRLDTFLALLITPTRVTYLRWYIYNVRLETVSFRAGPFDFHLVAVVDKSQYIILHLTLSACLDANVAFTFAVYRLLYV